MVQATWSILRQDRCGYCGEKIEATMIFRLAIEQVDFTLSAGLDGEGGKVVVKANDR